MTAQTIPELTNNDYNELYYNSAGTLISGSFMYQVCDLINKCGIDLQATNTYDNTVENAVSKFQQTVGTSVTGIMTTSTLQAMILYADKIDDIVESEDDELDTYESDTSYSLHYNSFFNNDNYKMHRRNHKDIKIIFGNKSITKTIKDVFMRSVSVEVDTSGNPVSEVYEFIARDVKESDEISDIDKYIGEEEKSSSDIKYNFSSIGVTSSKPSSTSSDSGRTTGGSW